MTTPDIPATALQLRSLVTPQGCLRVSLARVPVPSPEPDEVLIRLEASPLNPSDQGLLFGAADLSTAHLEGTGEDAVLTAQVPPAAMAAMAGRLGQSLPVGNEGAGTVVATGGSASAQRLLGRRVAVMGGAMYAQYRCLPADQCLLLPEDASAEEGASCYINPLTALAMLETLRHEGHRALVHTAAASNLGQMLVRVCRQDGVALVNVVRSAEQAALLRAAGAEHVCDSSSERFDADLADAIAATGATLAFDATGGGRLASRILSAMEVALQRAQPGSYSRYGTSIHKQVYLYGSLDTRPTELVRNFGMAWGIGGWLVFSYLQRVGEHRIAALKARVAAELRTNFASRYAGRLSLAEALTPDAIARYAQRATGAKYLITP